MLNSFEKMGNAMLLANEGEKQIAYFIINWVARLVSPLLKADYTKQPMSVKGA